MLVRHIEVLEVLREEVLSEEMSFLGFLEDKEGHLFSDNLSLLLFTSEKLYIERALGSRTLHKHLLLLLVVIAVGCCWLLLRLSVLSYRERIPI